MMICVLMYENITLYTCIFQASTNGILTFDRPYLRWWPPGNIQEIDDRTVLAPYFSDVDIRGSTGEVFYQTYDIYSGKGSSEAVQMAERYIRGAMRNAEFTAKFVLVVTWYDVPNYPFWLNPLCWSWWWWWWNCPASRPVS